MFVFLIVASLISAIGAFSAYKVQFKVAPWLNGLSLAFAAIGIVASQHIENEAMRTLFCVGCFIVFVAAFFTEGLATNSAVRERQCIARVRRHQP